MEPIMLFRRVRGRDDQLVLRRGARVAVVCLAGESWQWTVFKWGRAVDGRRDFELDALSACAEALSLLEQGERDDFGS